MEKELAYTTQKGFEIRQLDKVPSEVESEMTIVKPLAVGICGSDLNFIETLPSNKELFLGHEWVGQILKVAKDSKLKVGEIVTSAALIGCGKCQFCLDQKGNLCKNAVAIGSKDKGMIRTWAKIPEHALITLDKKIDPGALTLLEVAAVADETMRQLIKLEGQRSKILIVGCGPIGIFTALKAIKLGYEVDVLEMEPYRIKCGLELKIPVRSLGEWLLDRSAHQKNQLIIDCSGDNGGKPGIWKYLHTMVGINTKLIVVGKYSQEIKIDPILSGATNLLIKWTRGLPKNSFVETINEWKNEINDIAKIVISHKFPMERMDEAVKLAFSKTEALKIIIET